MSELNSSDTFQVRIQLLNVVVNSKRKCKYKFSIGQMNFWKQITASESRAIRWYDVDNTVQEFSYFEVIEAAKQFEVILNSIHTPVGSKSKLLAIVISHCASIVPIIIA